MLQYEMLEIFPHHAVDRIKKIDTVDHEILLHRLESVGLSSDGKLDKARQDTRRPNIWQQTHTGLQTQGDYKESK